MGGYEPRHAVMALHVCGCKQQALHHLRAANHLLVEYERGLDGDEEEDEEADVDVRGARVLDCSTWIGEPLSEPAAAAAAGGAASACTPGGAEVRSSSLPPEEAACCPSSAATSETETFDPFSAPQFLAEMMQELGAVDPAIPTDQAWLHEITALA